MTSTAEQEVILPVVKPLKEVIKFKLGFMVMMIECGRIEMANDAMTDAMRLLNDIPDSVMYTPE